MESMEAPDFKDQRREARISLSTVSLPFLGIRDAEHLTFEYFLLDASPSGIQLSIPEWVSAWNKLKTEDEITLFLPLKVGGATLNKGRILWLKRDEETREQNCGAQMDGGSRPGAGNFFLESDGTIRWQGSSPHQGFKDYIATLLKDSSLLKKNILIYLSHLVPYFSRIVKDRDRYPEIRDLIFDDIRRQVEEHHLRLKELAGKVSQARDVLSGFSEIGDFANLRRLMDSELDKNLFRMIFEKETVLWYLEEIKQLENRLYFNFNSLVLCNFLVLEETIVGREGRSLPGFPARL